MPYFGLAPAGGKAHNARMFRTTFTHVLGVAAAAAIVAPAFAAEWMTDLPAAQAKAAAEGKAVLVDFTGSDWCGWCVRLRQDVLDKPEFAEYAKDKFVLMEVDVPRNPNFDKELLAKNQQLCEKYKVSGFPTIMVLTPEGHVAGGFVGGMSSLDAVKEPLDAALKNAAALKAAESLEGKEKLQALHGVYVSLPEEFQAATDLRETILSLDTENVTGLRDVVKAEEQLESTMQRLQAADQERAKLVAIVDEVLPQAYPQNKPQLLNVKASIQLMLADSEEQLAEAKKTLLELAELDQEHAELMRAQVEKLFEDPAKLLQQVREIRPNH